MRRLREGGPPCSTTSRTLPWLYDHLVDYRSKKTLYAILSNWYRYDFITTAQTKESLFDDYFDLDLVTCTPEEVFVDLGAYTGDTVLSYLKNYGEDCYQRIYCYEITPETFQVLQETLAPYRDIVCRQKGVGDAEGTLSLVNHQTSASLQHPGARNRGGRPRNHLGCGHSRAHHHDQGGH